MVWLTVWAVVFGLTGLAYAPVQAAKILIVPAQTYSHCREVSSVGQALVNRGHNVSILFSRTYKHDNCHVKDANGTHRINVILLTPAPGIQSTTEMTRDVSKAMIEGKDFSFLTRTEATTKLVNCVCGNILSDTSALVALKKEKFDLVIADGGFLCYCFFVVPYLLNVPYVAMSSIFEDFVTSRPFLSSISPDVLSTDTDRMTFRQRVQNTFSQIAAHAMGRYFLPMDMVRALTPELSRQDIIDIVSKSELYLYNYDTILSYPLPRMPNHVFIGGVMTRPAEPLAGELKNYYEKSPDGVVLVTFGGNKLDLPESKAKSILRVLQKLNFNVIWKYGDGSQYGNVKQMKWVPQNDLLGHPNTKVFVSHCGNNGVYEALYHGVPLVCTPILGDQFYNGARVEHWNAGVSVSLMGSSEDELYNAITEVLNNPKYKKNMQRASQMYHSQPQLPRERAADAIEYVLKFGGDHLRSRASDMSVFTYMGYDVLCFVLGIIVTFIVILLSCVQCLCRRCRLLSTKVKTN